MILITGGTGWLGKTALSYLLQRFSDEEFSKNVIVFGSRKKELRKICI